MRKAASTAFVTKDGSFRHGRSKATAVIQFIKAFRIRPQIMSFFLTAGSEIIEKYLGYSHYRKYSSSLQMPSALSLIGVCFLLKICIGQSITPAPSGTSHLESC